MSVSVCLCVCLSAVIFVFCVCFIFVLVVLQLFCESSCLYLGNYTSDLHQIFAHVTDGRGSVLLRRRSDMLRTSGFADDVMFAHKLIACSKSPPG